MHVDYQQRHINRLEKKEHHINLPNIANVRTQEIR